ncbi:hypothetical protein AWH56_021820 [Anaerobacillus isosaccharinicus]|uniref:Novel STAND NTPase 5 domain-containing protein n=1 Tax=Anaerobacillus isosaccharinicus TaxID=1532552 RepID=A0A1S2MEX5_9BACI|nr:hypothetical protein [Anaerobacillus isosaccharinicus]MBA5586458.1 hypothetical protein [Anaerobacillus isosaccharinicus]QOY35299.1 hypothetical protein AWH56_021820 [Anaerobacillus isosaccharinicus]
MAKGTKKKQNKKRRTGAEIERARTGGQIALMGYDYQLVYSCYIALEFLDDENKSLKLEGIEDVDTFSSMLDDHMIVEHVQLKHSKEKQDASFFDSILSNFLEVYLTDKQNTNKYFRLVYDMEIAKGNLSMLIAYKLDKTVIQFWTNKIDKIKEENPQWDWTDFNFQVFSKQLKFEKVTQNELEQKISCLMIDKYEISTGNEQLFINSLFYSIFQAAKNRRKITHPMLREIVQSVKDDVARGFQNPAFHWFEKIDFNKLKTAKENMEYYEGKKASPADIINGLPIRRKNLEKEIEESITENKITVIKSSCGQGKTTLAWQAAYNLSKEFTVYKLNWCKETKEIDNIIQFINSRSKLGEKTLIVLDNLDVDLKEWNKLAQLLEGKITLNYRLLITSREDDWYTFAGDQSNLMKLKIINISLNRDQAKNIYENLKERNKIHDEIRNWQSAWERVEDKQILIEYIYLLTHGEMLEERLSQQLKNINTDKVSNIKLEVLRLISLADVIGIPLRSDKLINEITSESGFNADINEILQSLENEFFLKAEVGSYVEGLHPVRSQHISDMLHLYLPTSRTLSKLLSIVDESYIAKLFSQIALHVDIEQDEFYSSLSKKMKLKSYAFIVSTIEGLFSGSVLKYFKENKTYFDNANERGGLLLFLMEIGPWNSRSEMDFELKTLKRINEIVPENENIKYLLNMTEQIEKLDIEKSDLYIYAYYLYNELNSGILKRDISSYSMLASWLSRLSKNFDIVTSLNYDEIWMNREKWNFDEISLLMYEFHSLDPNKYKEFIEKNKDSIFRFLKVKTNSIKIFELEDDLCIEYILTPQDVGKANNYSVKRINEVCRFLPIYNKYITTAIKLEIELYSGLNLPDESYKAMPIDKIKLGFNTDLTVLWKNSILSHYEFPSIYDWQEHWMNIRSSIITFIKLNICVLEYVLKQSKLTPEVRIIDNVRMEIFQSLLKEVLFPRENRPFENPIFLKGEISMVQQGFFVGIKNYIESYLNIVSRKKEGNASGIAIYNLRDAKYKLSAMQSGFRYIFQHTTFYFDLDEIEEQESLWLDRLINMNEFYLNHLPRKGGYTRAAVKEWNKEKENDRMQLINDKMKKLSEESSFNFLKTKKLYCERNINFLPVSVTDVDVNSETEMGRLIFTITDLTDVIESDVHYIVLLFLTSKFEHVGNGLRVATSYLKHLKESIMTGKDLITDNLLLPLPIEINQQHLECFEENIKVLMTPTKYSYENVDVFLTLLWEYYQYQVYFDISDNIERDFLQIENGRKVLKLDQLLNELQQNCDPQLFVRLSRLKNDVLENKAVFNDPQLNAWVNELALVLK